MSFVLKPLPLWRQSFRSISWMKLTFPDFSGNQEFNIWTKKRETKQQLNKYTNSNTQTELNATKAWLTKQPQIKLNLGKYDTWCIASNVLYSCSFNNALILGLFELSRKSYSCAVHSFPIFGLHKCTNCVHGLCARLYCVLRWQQCKFISKQRRQIRHKLRYLQTKYLRQFGKLLQRPQADITALSISLVVV